MRTTDSWFTFERRCILCGQKLSDSESSRGCVQHLWSHIREGYLNEDLEQIREHPVGFPGPPLGQQPPCSSHTSPAL